jgi:Family of unknown function (DUF6356)
MTAFNSKFSSSEGIYKADFGKNGKQTEGNMPITDVNCLAGEDTMRRLFSLFSDHPATVGESYLEHAHMAAGFGTHMILGGLACLVHAALPFLFERTGSKKVALLHDRMIVGRDRCSSRTVASGSRL